MLRYFLKRLVMMIPILIGVSLIVFCICGTNTTPILLQLGGDSMTAEQMVELEHKLGFDQPVLVRYAQYMGGMLKGDLGKSHITNLDVFDEFVKTFPLTIKLSLASVFVSVIISLPLGIISALKRGGLTDNVSMVFALLGLATPNFWLGLMLIIAFSLKIPIFPSSGARDGIMSFILPAVTVGTGLTASLTRQTRSSMLEVIRSDYLRTARAKGCSEKTVIMKHALRNALIPIITVTGAQIAATLGGAATTETVFALPGIGRLVVTSISNLDVNMVTGCVTLEAMITAVIMLCVDLMYAMVDPRIKAQFARGGKKNG